MTQVFVSDATNIPQSVISILEKGKTGGGLDPLLTLLRYYSRAVHLENLLADYYVPISRKKPRSKKSSLEEEKAQDLLLQILDINQEYSKKLLHLFQKEKSTD